MGSWHLKLSASAKLLYAYIWDLSDQAGMWDEDLESANSHINFPVDYSTIQELVDAKVLEKVNDGRLDSWWINRKVLRLAFLSYKFTGHRAIIRSLKRFNLFDLPAVRTLFKDGDEYAVEEKRRKLKCDVMDKESSGERHAFNTMVSQGVDMKWVDWRRLCQMFPSMNKLQVMSDLAQFAPRRLAGWTNAGKRLWKIAVDMAELNQKGKRYNDCYMDALMGEWKGWGFEKCEEKKSPTPIQSA